MPSPLNKGHLGQGPASAYDDSSHGPTPNHQVKASPRLTLDSKQSKANGLMQSRATLGLPCNKHSRAEQKVSKPHTIAQDKNASIGCRHQAKGHHRPTPPGRLSLRQQPPWLLWPFKPLPSAVLDKISPLKPKCCRRLACNKGTVSKLVITSSNMHDIASLSKQSCFSKEAGSSVLGKQCPTAS